MRIKKFNDSVDWKEDWEEEDEVEQTFRDMFGEITTSDRINLTDNDVYTIIDRTWWGLGDYIVRLTDTQDENIKFVSFMVPTGKNNKSYRRELGYLLIKEGRPYILSPIPGDNRSATVFNNTFIVSGHDGTYLYNIDNPKDFLRPF